MGNKSERGMLNKHFKTHAKTQEISTNIDENRLKTLENENAKHLGKCGHACIILATIS